MKNKHTLLLIPTLIFPYAFVALIGAYFFLPLIFVTMDKFILDNVPVFGVGLLVLFVLSIAFNIIYIIVSRGTAALSVLETALILKCLQIPAYMLIFGFALLLGMMFIMTFPLILFLVFIDLLTLFLSNFISIYALAKCIKAETYKPKGALVIAIICQFFFCLDFFGVLGAYLLRNKK